MWNTNLCACVACMMTSVPSVLCVDHVSTNMNGAGKGQCHSCCQLCGPPSVIYQNIFYMISQYHIILYITSKSLKSVKSFKINRNINPQDLTELKLVLSVTVLRWQNHGPQLRLLIALDDMHRRHTVCQ